MSKKHRKHKSQGGARQEPTKHPEPERREQNSSDVPVEYQPESGQPGSSRE